ncbi:MAG: insulinase family protein [Dysgonamonadaceae bacterium]|jgi:predicted Zn-dependent peptidase|nr:insulinase family protein [Dysgonamonadaceae bacterium]
MTTIDRSIPPPFRQISQIPIRSTETYTLTNGVPVYYLNSGEQDVCRVDIMIGAGRWLQPKALVSGFTSQLLKEGAGKLNAKQMAEQLDFYGAWLQLSDNYHYTYLTLFTLNKYFKETVELLSMMFYEPHFSESEFQTLLKCRKQQFLIENDKVQALASKAFVGALFGKEHPYGKRTVWEDFDNICTDDLKSFHQMYYRTDNINIILSGKVEDARLKIIDTLFSAPRLSSSLSKETFVPETVTSASSPRVSVPKDNAIQNAIRMGLGTINRSHEDFPGLKVLNTILGGYFGSRLMSNIREEKGYTYGISSGITSYKHAAFLSIATQTAPEHTENLIAEVYREIDRLQSDQIDRQELEMVRNYMLGDFARSLDSTFSLIEAHISLLASGMDVNFLQKQIDAVKNITPEEIRALAARYLTKDNIIEVVAGKC